MSYDDTEYYGPDDPYSSPSEDEMLMQMLQQQQFQVPGKTPANQQTFLNGMFNILGYNPISLATGQSPNDPAMQQFVPEQWQEPLNPEREIYAGTPLYDTIFQAIENGANPIDATKAAYEALGMDMSSTQSSADMEETKQVATKFAMNLIDSENDRLANEQANATNQAQWEQKQAASADSYTRPDGSKYKNAPLGGTDIYGTASEYDLLGGDQIDPSALVAEYAKTVRPGGAAGAMTPVTRPSMDEAFRIHPPGQKPDKKGRGAGAPQNPTRAIPVQQMEETGGQFSDNALVNKYAQAEAQRAVRARLDRSKNTRVRSDANTNAMRVAAKYAQYMQRPFD